MLQDLPRKNRASFKKWMNATLSVTEVNTLLQRMEPCNWSWISRLTLKGFYFVLGNLPPQYRSRQKEIHLAIMCSSKLISKYGYQKILQPLVEDLWKLENEGIYIKSDNCVHQTGGGCRKFSYPCFGWFFLQFQYHTTFFSFLQLQPRKFESKFAILSFAIRIREGYDNNVLNINADKTISFVSGIKDAL